jgi:hypothetical protein
MPRTRAEVDHRSRVDFFIGLASFFSSVNSAASCSTFRLNAWIWLFAKR